VGVKLGSLASKEEQRLRVLKNKVLRKIFVSKWEEVRRNCTQMNFMICTPHQILSGWLNKEE